MPPSLTARRLHAQGISAPVAASPADAVRHLGAMQAQDYHAALWAVGLRTQGATLAQVEGAIERGEIVRTWPMRGSGICSSSPNNCPAAKPPPDAAT